jgi:hypothetical protein
VIKCTFSIHRPESVSDLRESKRLPLGVAELETGRAFVRSATFVAGFFSSK